MPFVATPDALQARPSVRRTLGYCVLPLARMKAFGKAHHDNEFGVMGALYWWFPRQPRNRTRTVFDATMLLLALGGYGYNKYRKQAWLPVATPVPAATLPDLPTRQRAAAASYRCDGRIHCAQMTSCQEATWFLQNCPGTKMDGNHDGVPCETQWCR